MPLLHKANAPDNAVCQSPNAFPVPRSTRPRTYPDRALTTSQAEQAPLRTCRRSYDPRSSGFPISHVYPRSPLFVTESETKCGAVACPKNPFAKKTNP